MCGRFALRLGRGEIRQIPGHQGVDVDEWIDEEEFVPRYNIAPRTNAPVLRRRSAGAGLLDAAGTEGARDPEVSAETATADSHYVLHTMKWGLVPHWSKFEDKTLSTTNARSENLVEGGGMWASIKGKKRCAVVCQGYYEWLAKGKDKLPHFTRHADGKVMLMAGLYDCVHLEGQTKPLWTFTIVTTAANKDFSWLHDRQPVILSTRAALDAWLDTSKQTWTPELTKLVEPYHDSASPLECYQVPKEVGKVGTESATFIEPIAKRKDGIQAMFFKQAAKSSVKPPSKTKPALKRSRSPSPIKPLDDPPSPTTSKKPRLDIPNVKDEDSDVVLLDGPSTPKKLKAEDVVSKKVSPAKQKPSKEKAKKVEAPASNAKLTSFFKKS
ncbi:putative SOS response associated peptidase (SRAP) [Lyophyllum shimeji]|uniref:SOS response associated peptidase (SRAP) n=1 Tax=Lyophyllum shimeji TaxID=47721 RepID=A0A9P3PZ07_LYOSH|nr:putative SOS response associated peptidase (SRAP) [Lyophyllum shimeji]